MSSEALADICANNGVELVDPVAAFENKYEAPEAFQRFINLLVTATTHRWRREEIRLLFDPAETPPNRVVSRFEIEAIEEVIPTLSIADAVERFRVIFDAARIPVDFESRVVDILTHLAERATSHAESEALAPILFNLELEDLGKCFEASAAVFSTANAREEPRGFDLFHPMIRHGLLEEFSAIIAAAAIELLYRRGVKISKAFRYHASQMYEFSPSLSELPEENRNYVLHWFNVAWADTRDIEHPAMREQRIGRNGLGLRRSFRGINQSLLNHIPRARVIPPVE